MMQQQLRTRQNQHIMDSSTVAHRCAMLLSEKGFTVLSIHIETRNPVVWIQECMKCKELDAATKTRRYGSNGFEIVMASYIHGCQVQWIVR